MMTDQFGGSILTQDGKHGNLSSPACLAAVQRMHDLVYKYHVAPRPEGIDSWLALRQGKVAMGLEGIYMLDSLREQTGLEFAGAPTPQFGPQPGDWAGSHCLCQPQDLSPERARAAWRLMRYLSDHSQTWAEGGQVPARSDIERAPAFQALPVQAQFAKQLPYVQYAPLVPADNSLFQFVDPAVESVLLDLQTPEDAMRDADRRIDQMLSRT
jgi:multiple sugar transport system substrate-binding protein